LIEYDYKDEFSIKRLVMVLLLTRRAEYHGLARG